MHLLPSYATIYFLGQKIIQMNIWQLLWYLLKWVNMYICPWLWHTMTILLQLSRIVMQQNLVQLLLYKIIATNCYCWLSEDVVTMTQYYSSLIIIHAYLNSHWYVTVSFLLKYITYLSNICFNICLLWFSTIPWCKLLKCSCLKV